MNSMENKEQISLEFAKELLRALYALDKPLNELSSIYEQMQDGLLKTQLYESLGEIFDKVLSDLMVPIYKHQKTLGRASEPGAWLQLEK